MTTNNDEHTEGPSSDPIEPSVTPIQDRLKKAYIDKFNTVTVSGMTPEQLNEHIADQEDFVKILQTQIQASLDVADEYSRSMSAAERARVREEDKKYRAKARPVMNADGTIKLSKPKSDKVVPIGDPGTKAHENLIDKLVASGMTREMATKLIQSGGK
jgi:hypothetical protein